MNVSHPPIAIHGNKITFEIAPVLLAADRFYPGPATVRMGGISNLFGIPGVPGYSEPGDADVATHAETQGLRYSVDNPDLRIILTVAEGKYRLIGRRSAGIASVADLKGKRIATVPPTSSGFFLHKLLKSVGLSYGDVAIEYVTPLSAMPAALADGRVDAVTIWEPEVERAMNAVGDDAIEFSGEGIYRELFNLNTTAANLRDPERRAKIVRFVRAVMDAAAAMRQDPSLAQPLVVGATGYPADLVARSWPHHAYPAMLAPDLLDVLVEEEIWLGRQADRQPRRRHDLASLIDDSVQAEAILLEHSEMS
ncbi:MAG: ABC transporter substrate-binding protein [Sphingomonas fennica]